MTAGRCPTCGGTTLNAPYSCNICIVSIPDPSLEDCTCDRDTILDGMATPGCPVHAPETVR